MLCIYFFIQSQDLFDVTCSRDFVNSKSVNGKQKPIETNFNVAFKYQWIGASIRCTCSHLQRIQCFEKQGQIMIIDLRRSFHDGFDGI